MTCHVDFPKLNDFGKAFKDAGFKFPQDDEDQLKVAPVMLGAEAQKQNFPKSVWPGSIPGMPPSGCASIRSSSSRGRIAISSMPSLPRATFPR